MKYIVLTISLLISFSGLKAQTTGLTDPLTNTTGWTGGNGYTITEAADGTEMEVACASVGTSYQIFQYNFTSTPLNLSNSPYIQINVRNPGTSTIKLRIDLQDATGNVTNTSPISFILPAGNAYETYNFDFTGKFSQTYPATATVNSAAITNVNIYINPGGTTGYTGTIYFDSLRIGTDAVIPPPPAGIKLNQIGFYPGQNKVAIAAETTKDSFYVVSSTKLDTLYRGLLGKTTKWVYSGELASKADFTSFDSAGTYYITTDSLYSFPFTIAEQVHNGVAKGLLKSYYYNRASMAITAPWGESWTRAEGTPDNVVLIDATAATTDRPTGTKISSPKGWYDAGDYNKYVVNAGITTYTILALYEHFPSYFDTLVTNIPESSNNIPDILDEALWEIRWLLTAQDTNNGGVYHKITDPGFDALTALPSQDNQTRYAVYMGTAATLDFTAVMAQAYRIFSDSTNYMLAQKLPGLADTCLKAAIKAYNWALANPDVTVTGNPSNITTGTYADGTLTDEWAWARMELYAALRQDSLYQHTDVSAPAPSFWIPGWQTVNTLGLITLVHYRNRLNTNGYVDTTLIVNQLLNLAYTYYQSYASSAYNVAMGQSAGDFDWGSNANVGNQGLVLLEAYRATGITSYWDAALSNLDYVLGRNGTFYSFITGFGSKPPLNPQHRISDALMALHAGLAPVPGLVVGGPNPGQQDDCPGYTSSYPGSSYLDTECSYSTNEPAINYTSAVTYLIGAVEAILQGASYTPSYTPPPANVVTGIVSTTVSTPIVNLFPNPAKGQVTVEFTANGTSQIVVVDMTGKASINQSVSGSGLVDVPLDISGLNKGIYVVSITTARGTITKKLVVQ